MHWFHDRHGFLYLGASLRREVMAFTACPVLLGPSIWLRKGAWSYRGREKLQVTELPQWARLEHRDDYLPR